MPRQRPAASGLTLVEVMIAVAISAILALAAAPFFGDYITNSRLRESGNALVAQTLLAQSEALKRNNVVRVQMAGSDVSLLDMAAGEPGTLIRQLSLTAPVSVAANTVVNFGSNGRPLAGDVAVNLKATGYACSADRRCPGLRVDAGGAVMLCGDYTNGCP